MRSVGFRLVTLGAVTLTDGNGRPEPTLAKRRRKLAVLAVLAVARRSVQRGQLAGLFWGDEDESRARHSLADALSNLRGVLGPDSVTTRQLEIALSSTCALAVDALELTEAAERRDYARVVELYRGPFLHEVAVSTSSALGQWVEAVRARLHRHWIEACSHRCLALARARRWDECVAIARRWLDAEPLSADAALYVLNGLKASATTEAYAAALEEYARMEQRLARDLGQSPAHVVAMLAASIRDELATRRTRPARSERVDTTPVPDAVATAEEASVHRRSPPRFEASRVMSLMVVVLIFLTATSFTSREADRSRRSVISAAAVVAVQDMRVVDDDSSLVWLARNMPLLITSELSRMPGVNVVAPDFVLEARADLGLPGDRSLASGDVGRLGRRVGAAWIVGGTVQRQDGVYVLDLSIYDVRRAGPPLRVRVAQANLVALATHAAAEVAARCHSKDSEKSRAS